VIPLRAARGVGKWFQEQWPHALLRAASNLRSTRFFPICARPSRGCPSRLFVAQNLPFTVEKPQGATLLAFTGADGARRRWNNSRACTPYAPGKLYLTVQDAIAWRSKPIWAWKSTVTVR